jgi:hypothetical protein
VEVDMVRIEARYAGSQLAGGILVTLLLGALVACGSDPPENGGSDCSVNPAGPSCPPPPPPPPTSNFVIKGQVVAYGTGAPIAGARVGPAAGSAVDTDSGGAFEIRSQSAPASTPIPVKVEAGGFVTRELYLRYQPGTRDGVVIDLIRNAAPFSLDFFNDLVRGKYAIGRGEYPDYDKPLTPVLRLETSPSVYVRTIDQNGRAVEPEVLATVLPAIRKAVTDWSNGTLSVSTLETGTETRPPSEGWIVINITRNDRSTYCGQATLGDLEGEVELVNDRCNCGSNKISGAIVAHEIGHALGFSHVGVRGSVMFPVAPGNCPPGNLSASERYHSAVAYSRTRGNGDPDSDPPWGALARPGEGRARRIVIEN